MHKINAIDLFLAFESDLSFEEELHKNDIFHDYFNIFLSLPVSLFYFQISVFICV